MKGLIVLDWVNHELPPLSWSVISLKMIKTFLSSGISPRKIDESTVFDDHIMSEMRNVVDQIYHKSIPL